MPDPPAVDADRFVWGKGDVVIVKRGTPDSGAITKRAPRPLTPAQVALAERIDDRRADGDRA